MQSGQGNHGAELSALEAMLTLHLSERDLMPVINGTRIDRGWYVSAVGLPDRRPAAEIFDRFDQLAQEAMKIDDVFLAAVDQHLSTAIAQRTLATKKGEMIRQRIKDWFGWPRWVLKTPLVVSRLDYWDAELARRAYVSDWKAVALERKRWASSPPSKWSVFRARVSTRYTAGETSVAHFRAVLEKHLKAGSLLRNGDGTLSLTSYAELAGISNVTSAHREILREFQRRAGPVISDVEQKLPKISDWFRSCVCSRTLPVHNNGRIDVTALRQRFSISMGRLKSSQALRDLIESFNKELIRINYRRADDFFLEKKLLKALPDATLQTNGLAIAVTTLARRLKCSHRILQRPPFKEHVEKANERHIANVADDPAWAYFPKHRAVDFRPLIKAGWSSAIIGVICKALKDNLSGVKRARRNALMPVIIQFLTKLATSKVKCVRSAFDAVNQRGNVSDHDWILAIDELGRGLNGNSTKHVNFIIDLLVRAQVFPAIRHRLSIPSRVKIHGNRTVAEVVPKSSKGAVATIGTETMPVARLYVSFANWVLLQKSSWNETEDFRGDSFLSVLQAEIEKWTGELPKDPVQAISKIIGRRLTLIVESAERRFEFWRRHYLDGQKLRSEGVDLTSYADILFGSDLDNNEYRQALSRYFSSEPVQKRQGLANLVRLAHDRFGGLVPRDREIEGRFFVHRCKQYGISVDDLQAYLTPHREAFSAAMTIYMVESGCNVAVARTLFHDCIEETDIHGFRKITGYKARARGKPIVINLPEDSKALQALCWLRDNNEIARDAAPQAIRDLFFIAVVRREVVEISPEWFLASFKRIVGYVSDLAELGITPVMLRPSVLLRHALDNDGDLRVGLAYGQHEPGQTGVYQVRLPTKFIYDQLYSQFQKRIQKIILGMAARLRADEAPSLGPDAKPIGLGGVCAVGGCSELTCWKNCSNLVVVPEVNALADWQIWNVSLREVRSEWERDRIERWEAMWLPFLCFTDVLAAKMQQGSNALSRLWDDATQRAKELMSTDGFVMPRPF